MARKKIETRPPSQRQLKVGEHIRHMLSMIIQRNDFHSAILSQNIINISQVKMTPDLRQARIFIKPLTSNKTQEVVDDLNHHSYIMRQAIAKNLTMKFLPRLRFMEDTMAEHIDRLEQLLNSDHVSQDLTKV